MYVLILVLGGSLLPLVGVFSVHRAVIACGPTFLKRRRVCSLGVEVVDAIRSLNAYRDVSTMRPCVQPKCGESVNLGQLACASGRGCSMVLAPTVRWGKYHCGGADGPQSPRKRCEPSSRAQCSL